MDDKETQLIISKIKNRINEMACEGKSLQAMCEELITTPGDLAKLLVADKHFAKEFGESRMIGLEYLADKLLETDEYGQPTITKEQAANIKWILTKRKPETYGEKLDLKIHKQIDLKFALDEAKKRSLPVIETQARIEDEEDIFS